MMIYRQALDDARKSLELAHEMSKAVGMAMDGGTGYFNIAKKDWYRGLPETLTRKTLPFFLMRDEEKRRVRHLLRGEDPWGEEEPSPWQDVTTAIYGWDNYDRSCEKAFFEGVHLAEQERKETIEELWEHWYNPWDDGRDCTGVWFTSRISIFDVPNGTWIYHFKSCDV